MCLTQPRFLFQYLKLGHFSEEEPLTNNCSQDIYPWIQNSSSQNESDEISTVFCDKRKGLSDSYQGYILVVVVGVSAAFTTLLLRGTKVHEVTCDIQLVWTHCLGVSISIILMGIMEKPELPQDLYLSLAGHIFSILVHWP